MNAEETTSSTTSTMPDLKAAARAVMSRAKARGTKTKPAGRGKRAKTTPPTRKKARAKTGSRTRAKKPSAKKPSRSDENKSAFVRSMPATMPGKEVIARAKERGMKISRAYVYSIRASAKKKGQFQVAALPSGDTEKLLLLLGAEIGLSKSITLLEKQRGKLPTLASLRPRRGSTAGDDEEE